MNTFKWVLCTYDKWYFIEYENEDSFAGWFYFYNEFVFYATSNFMSQYPNAARYFGGKHTKITKNSDLKKDQWSRFLKGDRIKLPRRMIEDILS